VTQTKHNSQIQFASTIAPLEVSDPQRPTNLSQLILWATIICLLAFSLYIYFDNLRQELSSVKEQLASKGIQPSSDNDSETFKLISDELRFAKDEVTQLNKRYKVLEKRMLTIDQQAPPTKIEPSNLESTTTEKTDNWIVNLLSLANEDAALAFADKLRLQGIEAEVNVKYSNTEKQVWRVQVSGFSTKQLAIDYSEQTSAILKINSMWVYKDNH
jgi:hypothetical protein